MRSDRILLAHGSGGTMMRELIEEVFVTEFAEDALKRLDDAASLAFPGSRLAFSTDTYVVTPQFFPGGDIGRLAVCGTVNDVATSGATPLYLSVGFVLEEGMPIDDLRRILHSMREAAEEAGVHIVTGDTKVVEKGHGDGIYINTAGVGVLAEGVDLSGSYAKPGDKVLVSGTLGDHGIAIVSTREGLEFETDIETDAAPLAELCAAVLEAAPGHAGLPRSDARRAREHAQRDRGCLGRLDHGRGDLGAGEAAGAGRLRDARLRRLPGRQRGQDGGRSCPPSRPRLLSLR